MIDKWEGDVPAVDGPLPEEWIMSTITARGNDRPEDEGLSMIETADGMVLLRDLISSDPTLFLGCISRTFMMESRFVSFPYLWLCCCSLFGTNYFVSTSGNNAATD